MELLILIVAFVLWILQKALSSQNKEAAKKRKKRPPAPTPWRDPWGADGYRPPSGFSRGGDHGGSRTPSLSIRNRIGGEHPKCHGRNPGRGRTGEDGCSGGDLRGGKTGGNPEGGTASDSGRERKKKVVRLEEGLFTKNSLVRGIILQEVLGPPPSRRYLQRTHRRAP